MQEPGIYSALFAELSDAQIGKIVGDEFRRRNYIGALFFVPASEVGGRGVFMSICPEEYVTGKSAAEQLILFAAVAATCKERRPKTWYDPDDDILSDTTPWAV